MSFQSVRGSNSPAASHLRLVFLTRSPVQLTFTVYIRCTFSYSLSLSPVTHMAACGSSNQLSPPVLHCSPSLPLPYIFPIPSLLFSLSLPAGAFETLKVSNNTSGIISLFCFVSLMKSLFDLDADRNLSEILHYACSDSKNSEVKTSVFVASEPSTCLTS